MKPKFIKVFSVEQRYFNGRCSKTISIYSSPIGCCIVHDGDNFREAHIERCSAEYAASEIMSYIRSRHATENGERIFFDGRWDSNFIRWTKDRCINFNGVE